MDEQHQHQQKQSSATATQERQAGGKAKIYVAPACLGPRRLAFRIRRRPFSFQGNPSLLVSNRCGVWSVTHRRYIRKTSYYRYQCLKTVLLPVWRQVFVDKKMQRWAQYKQDEELRALRHKLADMYWAVMPEDVKAGVVLFHHGRHRKQRGRERRREQHQEWQRRCQNKSLNCYTAAVVCIAMVGYVLLRLVLGGYYSTGMSVFLVSGYLLAVYLLDRAWHAC